jgi:hypothetical protein
MTKLEKLKAQLVDIQTEIVELEEAAKKKDLAKAAPLEIEMAEVTTKFVMRKIPRYCPGCWSDLAENKSGKGIAVYGYSPSHELWLKHDDGHWVTDESVDEGDLSYVTSVHCAVCEKVLAEVKEK